MKKTIEILVEKMDSLQGEKDGTLHGGFASIKGGFNTTGLSTNESCTNSKDCTQSTNNGTPSCTNSGSCFM